MPLPYLVTVWEAIPMPWGKPTNILWMLLSSQEIAILGENSANHFDTNHWIANPMVRINEVGCVSSSTPSDVSPSLDGFRDPRVWRPGIPR